MGVLLDGKGNPITASHPSKNYRKAKPPVLGEAFGSWAGRDLQYLELPGYGAVQFDLSRLTLADFRAMSTHYQVNSSLTALSFMLHQLQWTVECDSERVAKAAEDNLRGIWGRLVRAFSQAFWAGFSPNILQWENDVSGKRIILAKIKDLVPEEATVNWKKVDGALPPDAPSGAIPPKINVYDGIKQAGVAHPIPRENTLWYPLLMSNGDYYGRKLLKYAFQPWYFSTLIHLFTNRYFERFGEPVPVGRAPENESVALPDGREVDSNAYMLEQLAMIRSRASVVLPSTRQYDREGNPTNAFEYDISYLEANVRGADFERYLTRLDEEISLALFTPLLLMRTADVGSYNLGVGHQQMYLRQLNAIADDWAEYINRYIMSPFADYNFGINAARPRIKFYKMGKTQAETNRAVLSELVRHKAVRPDLVELGQAVGLTLEEIEVITSEDEDEGEDAPEIDDREARVRDDQPRVSDSIIARITPQAQKAFRAGTFGHGWEPDFGHTSKVDAITLDRLRRWNDDVMSAHFSSADEYMRVFSAGAKEIVNG